MQTIVLNEPLQLEVREAPMPEPGPGEALVRVRRIGICGTDLHAFEGTQPYFSYPRILGHELSVEIAEIGANTAGLKPGDLCVVNPYLNCGHCIACRNGKPNCCAELKVLGVHVDGGMAEYMTVPDDKLVPAGKLDPDQAALVENQCIGCHAVRRANLEAGEDALVIGAGPIGLGVIQFAQLSGARVIVLDISQERLAFCRDALGVQDTIHASDQTEATIRSMTSGDLPTAVFDATGSAASMQRAFDLVAAGGRLVLVGLVQAEIGFHDPEFHRREMTLLSSRNATRQDFETVIECLEAGKVQVAPLITHRVAFDRVVAEFGQWLAPDSGVVKAIVEMDQS
jgi:2-desacetyl-2-hydroxyethyl bacteriochlorophyllide A dehydrogenase